MEFVKIFLLWLIVGLLIGSGIVLNHIDAKLGDIRTIQSEARDALNCQTWVDESACGEKVSD